MVGTKYINKYGYEYEVLEEIPGKSTKTPMVRIRFLDSGYENIVQKAQVRQGLVKDRLAKHVFGVASIGLARKRGNEILYSIWNNMISRCYNVDNAHYKCYGSKGVTVSNRWLRFDLFLEDIVNVPGYDLALIGKRKLHLDKDLRSMPGLKIYSLDTCTFLPIEENVRLQDSSSKTLEFLAIDPAGKSVRTSNIRELCRKTGLTPTHVGRVLSGKAKQHKGWRFIRTP